MRSGLVILVVTLLHADAEPHLAELRKEASALVLLQNVLSWYTITVGEASMTAETYAGHQRLFSRESIDEVGRALAKATGDERRALQFLKSYLEAGYLNQNTAAFDDEVANAKLKATVKLSWHEAPVPYNQLTILVDDERDPKRRAEIDQAQMRVLRDTINPILERKETKAQKVASELGYPSYVKLSEEIRLVDLRSLIAEGRWILDATEAAYKKLLGEAAEKELKTSVAKVRRSDLGRLAKVARLEKYFPRELMIPSFTAFLAGIGLDLKTAGGEQIRIDDAQHPLKDPRAVCFNLRVPDDVRISVKPTGGVEDFANFFHEGGHAEHFANATTKVWEFQQLGPSASTEGFANMFGFVWDDPVWLRRYRTFVARYNTEHKTRYPLMNDDEVGELVRMRVFYGIHWVRLFAGAKLPYEVALHVGDPSLYGGALEVKTGDLQELYRRLFEQAYGFPLSKEDALSFRIDVDDTFYAADYTRSFAVANLMLEGLRKKFGEDWYGNKAVGALLKTLYAEGQKIQPDDIGRAFGAQRVDFKPTEARYSRLLGPPDPELLQR